MQKPYAVDMTPAPVIYPEKIGDTTWQLHQAELDVSSEVRLWHENPRILPHLPAGGFSNEDDLEATMRITPGYDNLRRSVEDLGQMEPIYVWRASESDKYVVLEGSTRVAILRELKRKYASKGISKYDRVKAKVLPPHFGPKERAILLARIHVRGTGVRAWGRYIEAKFIYDNVEGEGALMTITEMANYMEKSVSWVGRLRGAYEFALKFIETVDNEDAEKIAVKQFSVLEEISKVTGLGSKLRDYNNSAHDELRKEVFDMVQKGAFKEYRDARFLGEFYADPDKWAQLKSGQENIASKLAAEVKTSGSSVKAKIAGISPSIERALTGDHELDEDDARQLEHAAALIQQSLHTGVDLFRIQFKGVTKLLSNMTLANVKALQPDDLKDFKEALDYFDMLRTKYSGAAA